MIEASQLTTLLGGSSYRSDASAANLVGNLLKTDNKDLAAVTQTVLSGQISAQQEPEASQVSFSDELRTFISENVEGPKGEKLLADLDAVERLGERAQNGRDSAAQLLGGGTGNSNEPYKAGNILDLLA